VLHLDPAGDQGERRSCLLTEGARQIGEIQPNEWVGPSL
jgi:hypothetical protein